MFERLVEEHTIHANIAFRCCWMWCMEANVDALTGVESGCCLLWPGKTGIHIRLNKPVVVGNTWTSCRSTSVLTTLASSASKRKGLLVTDFSLSMAKVKKTGPRWDSWGTPAVRRCWEEKLDSTKMCIFLSVMKSVSVTHFSVDGNRQEEGNWMILSWLACQKPKKIPSHQCFLSKAYRMVVSIWVSWSVIECFCGSRAVECSAKHWVPQSGKTAS